MDTDAYIKDLLLTKITDDLELDTDDRCFPTGIS